VRGTHYAEIIALPRVGNLRISSGFLEDFIRVAVSQDTGVTGQPAYGQLFASAASVLLDVGTPSILYITSQRPENVRRTESFGKGMAEWLGL
jgi:hypothetical protein